MRLFVVAKTSSPDLQQWKAATKTTTKVLTARRIRRIFKKTTSMASYRKMRTTIRRPMKIMMGMTTKQTTRVPAMTALPVVKETTLRTATQTAIPAIQMTMTRKMMMRKTTASWTATSQMTTSWMATTNRMTTRMTTQMKGNTLSFQDLAREIGQNSNAMIPPWTSTWILNSDGLDWAPLLHLRMPWTNSRTKTEQTTRRYFNQSFTHLERLLATAQA